MGLSAAHFDAGVILVVTVYSYRYLIPLFHHLESPFSTSLRILVVSVGVKIYVYLLHSVIRYIKED